MITKSNELLRDVAAIDTNRIAEGCRFLQRIVDKASAVAGRAAHAWTVVLLIELGLGAFAAWYFGTKAGWQSRVTIGVIIAFGVLVILLATLVYVLTRIARLPHSIDAVSGTLTGIIGDARHDYGDVQQSTGWRASLGTLLSAGKLLRAAHRAMRDHEGDVRCFAGALLMATPAFWLVNVVLAGACVCVPLAVAIVAVLRASW